MVLFVHGTELCELVKKERFLLLEKGSLVKPFEFLCAGLVGGGVVNSDYSIYQNDDEDMVTQNRCFACRRGLRIQDSGMFSAGCAHGGGVACGRGARPITERVPGRP